METNTLILIVLVALGVAIIFQSIKAIINQLRLGIIVSAKKERRAETREARARQNIKARGIGEDHEDYEILLEEEIKALEESDKAINSHYYFASAEKIEEKRAKRAEYWGISKEEILEQRDPELKKQIRKLNRQYFGQEGPVIARDKREVEKIDFEELPEIKTEKELAEFFGITLEKLRWFSYNKETERYYHYSIFKVPKIRGGFRTLMAPKKELKSIQHKILHDILEKIPAENEFSHGFMKGKSIKTNAQVHLKKQIVINIDIQDFFNTVTYPRVRGMFQKLGYNYNIASVLALLSTEYIREPVLLDDGKYYVAINERALPQGAPTSPFISNFIAYQLDKRLSGLAQKNGFGYSRYADDLTFSGNDLAKVSLLSPIKKIINDEGFKINEKKTRILRKSRRQEVTGIVVNDKLNVNRKTRKKLRAILYNAGKTGLESQNRNNHKNFYGYIKGMIAYINMCNPELAQKFSEKLKEVDQVRS